VNDGKDLNSLKEDLNSKESTLGSNTSSERGQSSYHLLTKEPLQNLRKIWETNEKSLKKES